MAAVSLPELGQDGERNIQKGDLIDFWDGGQLVMTNVIESINTDSRYDGPYLVLEPYIQSSGPIEHILTFNASTGKYRTRDMDGEEDTHEVSFRLAPEIGENYESVEYLKEYFNDVMFKVAKRRGLLLFADYENPVFNDDMTREQTVDNAVKYWQRILFDPDFQAEVEIISRFFENATVDNRGNVTGTVTPEIDMAANTLANTYKYLEGYSERYDRDIYNSSKSFAETYKRVRDEYMRRLEMATKPAR